MMITKNKVLCEDKAIETLLSVEDMLSMNI